MLPAGVGEVRQAHPPRRVLLREEDLLGWAGQRTPLPDPPLQRAQHAVKAAGISVLQIAQHRRAEQARVGREQWHDLAIPDFRQWVGARALSAARLLAGQDRIGFDAPGGAGADPDLGGCGFLAVGSSERHVAGDLSVGDSVAGHSRTSSRCD